MKRIGVVVATLCGLAGPAFAVDVLKGFSSDGSYFVFVGQEEEGDILHFCPINPARPPAWPAGHAAPSSNEHAEGCIVYLDPSIDEGAPQPPAGWESALVAGVKAGPKGFKVTTKAGKKASVVTVAAGKRKITRPVENMKAKQGAVVWSPSGRAVAVNLGYKYNSDSTGIVNENMLVVIDLSPLLPALAPPPVTTVPVKPTLEKTDITQGLGAVKPAVKKCGEGSKVPPSVVVKLMIEPGGSVSSAVVATPALAGTGVATCIEGAVKLAKFPPFAGPAPVSVSYPFPL